VLEALPRHRCVTHEKWYFCFAWGCELTADGPLLTSLTMAEQPPLENDEVHPEQSDDLVDRTEKLADKAIDRLRVEAQLPDVKEEVGRLAHLVRTLYSRFLGLVVVLCVIAGISGTAFGVLYRFPDWYMHLAMYFVVLSHMVIYAKSHIQDRRIPRAFYALLTSTLMVFFAWVLIDLVPERLIVDEGEVVRRVAAPMLWVPGVLLLLTSILLLFHWLVLARHGVRGE
jgi:hypothetical protein